MATEGINKKITIFAGADLSSLQYNVINIAGTLAISPALAVGVLQNAPQSGEHASVAYEGHMKAKAGGTIAAGNELILSTSGTLIAGVGSAGIVGKALAAASSGGLVSFVGNFATAF